MSRTKPSRLCYRAVEFRAAEESSDGRTLEGYAAVFDTPTRIDSWEGTFDEVVVKGAFRKSLRERTPVLQFDHGRDVRTGSVPIGSIEELSEDDTGLFVSARLYDNDVVEPIRQAIEGGSIDGMSFRFRVLRDEWRDKDGKLVKDSELLDLLWSPGERGPLQRSIKEVELFELGPVVFPAYEATSVGVRSMLADLDERQRESLVRELLDELRPRVAPPDTPVDEPAPEEEPTRSGKLPPLSEWLTEYRKKQKTS
ncbi:HK97 family phage prohead protease [Prauserella endophytica]|uniref:HK97 family phage prohead protease n=1 Tax=Prauserella endophytica TaxID=1592324 RepID=A0ABY2RST0_9PSEU|nr:HK97 family phage prohead protease [Prauserella endophytica]TKG58890.1 HK97 family phage prohead protease [Prauserella endophytica]